MNILIYKSLSVQTGMMTCYYVLFGSTQEFFSTSAHFITHPLPMPRLFQPSCLYQHDTSLGLVSSPSSSKSGHHSLNPQHKRPPSTDGVCVCLPTRKTDIPNRLSPKTFQHDQCACSFKPKTKQ